MDVEKLLSNILENEIRSEQIKEILTEYSDYSGEEIKAIAKKAEERFNVKLDRAMNEMNNNNVHWSKGE